VVDATDDLACQIAPIDGEIVVRTSAASVLRPALMAADLNRPVTELLVEALNLLFRQHGLPEICMRWAPEAGLNFTPLPR
jgi:hypothetical protein